MHILVTGANGFIGSHIVGALLEAHHEVTAAVRSPRAFCTRFPLAKAVHCDFNRDTDPACWRGRLHGVDAVINCAGILRGGLRQSAKAIHIRTPAALFQACKQASVRRVIHISAVSADINARTGYAHTKAEAEQQLKNLDLDWIILRPSLVYAAGSYGGTSFLRGLASLPWILPTVGTGGQLFRPIHARDLAAGTVRLLERPGIARITMEPGGPENLSMLIILRKLRAWLGLRPALDIRMPVRGIQAMARIGDLVNATSFNTTALRQLEFGNTGDPESFIRLTELSPSSMDQWLLRQPSHVQDRWHARLVWLTPCLRYALATLWLASGLIGLFAGHSHALTSLHSAGFSTSFAEPLTSAGCALDLAIGLAILAHWKPRLLGGLQLIVIAAYTIALSIVVTWLWANPLGPLLKNLPILAAIGIWMVVEDKR